MSESVRGGSAQRKVVVAAALGAVVAAGLAFLVPWQLLPLIGWDTAALVYLVWVWRGLWKLDARATAQHIEREDPTRGTADLIVILAAIFSLGAVGLVLVGASGGTLTEGIQVAFAVVSVVLSWSLVHTIFTIRYAEQYYIGEDGGIDFNQNEPPCFSDFAYVAFTIGMTFQVSDTGFTTTRIRSMALRHALLSYLFGTVIVALTINMVAGLTK
jgi:uncharacterized membrane protein